MSESRPLAPVTGVRHRRETGGQERRRDGDRQVHERNQRQDDEGHEGVVLGLGAGSSYVNWMPNFSMR